MHQMGSLCQILLTFIPVGTAPLKLEPAPVDRYIGTGFPARKRPDQGKIAMTALNARFFQDVRTVFLAVILALWAGMAGAETSAARTLRDAWIRPPLAEGRPAALYFVLDNPGAATAITAVATPAAGRTELHTHAMAHHGDHGNH